MERQEKLENIKEYLRVRKDVANADGQYNEAMKQYALGCKTAINEIEELLDDYEKLEKYVLIECNTFDRDHNITSFNCGYIHIYDQVRKEIKRKY